MIIIESIFFVERPKSVTCLCPSYFKLQEENDELRAKLKKCEFVYSKEKAYQDTIRMLREKVLILESQNRVYASILEKGDKNDKRA